MKKKMPETPFREKEHDNKKGKRAYRERIQQDKEAEELIEDFKRKLGVFDGRHERVDGQDTL